MKRREFITLLGGAAGVAAGGAGAAAGDAGDRVPQRPVARQIAYLSQAFREGLKQSGYIEGQNVAIEYRSSMANTIDCLHWRPSWSAIEWL